MTSSWWTQISGVNTQIRRKIWGSTILAPIGATNEQFGATHADANWGNAIGQQLGQTLQIWLQLRTPDALDPPGSRFWVASGLILGRIGIDTRSILIGFWMIGGRPLQIRTRAYSKGGGYGRGMVGGMVSLVASLFKWAGGGRRSPPQGFPRDSPKAPQGFSHRCSLTMILHRSYPILIRRPPRFLTAVLTVSFRALFAFDVLYFVLGRALTPCLRFAPPRSYLALTPTHDPPLSRCLTLLRLRRWAAAKV